MWSLGSIRISSSFSCFVGVSHRAKPLPGDFLSLHLRGMFCRGVTQMKECTTDPAGTQQDNAFSVAVLSSRLLVPSIRARILLSR